MKSFLSETSADILARHKEHMHRLCLIFPNKRNIHYFKKYYAAQYPKAHKAPRLTDISGFIAEITGLQNADKLTLLLELFEVFKASDPEFKTHTFEHFYRIGEIILSDFNEIDSWLVNPELIFKNIRNVKEIESYYDFLSEEQKDLLKQFWSNYAKEKSSREINKFLQLWNLLPKIYKKYTQKLLQNNLSYRGLQFRKLSFLIDAQKVNTQTYEQYIFIGFNALNAAELKLFDFLRKENKASFYWNTDAYYQNNAHHEAGLFLRKNFRSLEQNKNLLPENFSQPKNIKVIGAPHKIGQAKILHKVLQSIPAEELHTETAILTANETALFPLLSALPEEVQSVNITMGYPFVQTPVYKLIKKYTDLHLQTLGENKLFQTNSVKEILKYLHTFSKENQQVRKLLHKTALLNKKYIPENFFEENTDELIGKLFQRIEPADNYRIYLQHLSEIIALLADSENSNALNNEYVYKAYTLINRFQSVMLKYSPEMSLKTCSRLLLQSFGNERIPFESNDFDGLQIMGIMEARNLDFKNLILQGLNEGEFPQKTQNTTFISQSVRRAFDMPVAQYKDAIFAYVFYAAIQRAENITLIYNNITEDGSGEPGRFILQLLYESSHTIKQQIYDEALQPVLKNKIHIRHNEEIQKQLEKYIVQNGKAQKRFSSASLSTYLDCKLKFYFKYIAELSPPQEPEEEFSPISFGNLLHQTMENLYTPFLQKNVNSQDIDLLLQKAADESGKEISAYFETPEEQWTGTLQLLWTILTDYTKIILQHDKKQTPFLLHSLEKTQDFVRTLQIPVDGKAEEVQIFGIIDRIDKKNEELRIIDYKTGSEKRKFKHIPELFENGNPNRPGHVFQLFLYAFLYAPHLAEGQRMSPHLYYTRSLGNTAYQSSPIFNPSRGKNEALSAEILEKNLPEFEEQLTETIRQIFSQEVDFEQCIKTEPCQYCDYNLICRR